MFIMLPALLWADRFSVQGSVAGFYDSNIEHLSIDDQVAMGKRQGFFIRNAGAAEYAFGDIETFSAALSLSSDTGLNVPEKSRFNSFFELGWHGEPRDDLSLDLALQIHHTAENYLHMRNMFLDLFLTGDIFWDISEDHAAYGTLKTGYFTGFDEELRYMTGPSVGIETGYFYYPTPYTDYLKAGAGFEGYFFRPEIINSCTEDNHPCTLYINNSSVKPYLFIEGKYDIAPVFLKATLRYAYMEWLGKDSNTDNGFNERRREHIPSLSAQALWEITGLISLSLNYSYRYIFSNFSRDNGAYLDYTMDRHTIRLELAIRYEGEAR